MTLSAAEYDTLAQALEETPKPIDKLKRLFTENAPWEETLETPDGPNARRGIRSATTPKRL